MSAACLPLAEQVQRSRVELWSLIRDYMASYAGHRPIMKVIVVANAPLPPSEERATEIDSGDLVIRTNALVLDDPAGPACIGSVCHVALLSPNTTMTPWALHDYRERGYLVPQVGWDFHPTKTIRDDPRMSAPFWPADLGALPLPNAVLKPIIGDLLAPDRRKGWIIPTTGTIAAFLAHEMFPEAELIATGFSFLDDPTQKSWAHHAGSHTRVHWQHRLNHEADLLRSWIDDGSLRMLY
jgi:hypothetical protein